MNWVTIGLPGRTRSAYLESIEEFGGPEKLKAMDLPRPKPEKSEVLIRAVAAGGSPPANATGVDSPTLEEAYLAVMASRGRADE